jgi:hypothetical protein
MNPCFIYLPVFLWNQLNQQLRWALGHPKTSDPAQRQLARAMLVVEPVA